MCGLFHMGHGLRDYLPLGMVKIDHPDHKHRCWRDFPGDPVADPHSAMQGDLSSIPVREPDPICLS